MIDFIRDWLNGRAYAAAALLSLIVFISGCVEENPDLVNPPSQAETVKIRFFNLASDKGQKSLLLEGKTETALTPYGNISAAIEPPADSINLAVKNQSGAEVVRTHWRTRLIRESNFTVFYIPVLNDTIQNPKDTVYVMGTITGLPYKAKKSYLKLANMVPDKNVRYSLNIGCPNGTSIASNIPFGQVSGHAEIRTDSLKGVAVTITRYETDKEAVSKLYNPLLYENRQYAIVIFHDESGLEKVCILDEFNSEITALTELNDSPEENSYVRTINFSTSSVDLRKKHEESSFAEGIAPGHIDIYRELAVCKSETPDTILTLNNNDTASVSETKFEVMENYSALVFDFATFKARLTVLAGPVFRNDTLRDFCVVRVVHANYNYDSTDLNAVLGARDYGNNAYRAGEKLAPNVKYGKISSPVLIREGIAPISFFTSTNPDKLIYTAVSSFERNKSYIIVLCNDASGKDAFYIIEDSETDKQVQPMEEAVFVQIVNIMPGASTVNITLPPILNNINLYYESTISTVIPLSSNSVTIAGRQLSFTPEKGKRLLIIAGGSASNPDIFHFNSLPIGAKENEYRHRVINACAELPQLTVRFDSDSGAIACKAEFLDYKEISNSESKNIKKDLSLYFLDAEKDIALTRRNLARSFGKNYTIIFGGKKNGLDKDKDKFDDGYTVVEIQEF